MTDRRSAKGPAKRLDRGRLRALGGGVQRPFGLIETGVPWIAVDQAATGAGRVRLEAARSEQDPDAFAAQGLDAAAERYTVCQGGVTKGSTTVGTARSVVSASTPRT